MPAGEPAPKIAIVIPVFNEEEVLPELLARLDALFVAHQEVSWEAVLVDDGSRDRSVELIQAQMARDPRFRLVEFSRNFGFQAALVDWAIRKGRGAIFADCGLGKPGSRPPGPCRLLER